MQLSLYTVIFFFFCFVRAAPVAYGISQAGVKSELQLPAYTTATAMLGLSCICNLYHSSQQCQILNPLSEARDRTRNLMVPNQIHFRHAMMGTPGATFSFSPGSSKKKMANLIMFLEDKYCVFTGIIHCLKVLRIVVVLINLKIRFREFPSWRSG